MVLKGPALAGQRIIEESLPEIETKASSLLDRSVKVILQADQASALPVEADVVDRIKKDERITSLADKIKGQIISIEQIKGE